MSYNAQWICADCGLELFGETMYMVHDRLWLSVMETDEGHLCPLCLEARLGRRLKARDFGPWPINDWIMDRLVWMREQGRDALLADARSRREKLDRRSARARELRALKKARD
jgi:hypothetical protein